MEIEPIKNIDLDWLLIQKKMTDTIDEKYVKERMDAITVHFIHIDDNNSKKWRPQHKLLKRGRKFFRRDFKCHISTIERYHTCLHYLDDLFVDEFNRV